MFLFPNFRARTRQTSEVSTRAKAHRNKSTQIILLLYDSQPRVKGQFPFQRVVGTCNSFIMGLWKEIMDSNTDTQEIFSITAQPVPEFKLIKSTSLDLTHSLSGTVEKYCLALEKLFGRTKYNIIRISFGLSLPSFSPLLFISKDLSQIQKSMLFKLQFFITVSQSNTESILSTHYKENKLCWNGCVETMVYG